MKKEKEQEKFVIGVGTLMLKEETICQPDPLAIQTPTRSKEPERIEARWKTFYKQVKRLETHYNHQFKARKAEKLETH